MAPARSRSANTCPAITCAWLKNKSYWQAGKPYFDELYVQFFKDQQAMVVALEAGAIDVADSPPTPDAVRLQKDANFQVLSNPFTGTYVMIAANVTMPPLDNRKVRQALNYAIDRKRIVETAYSGFGEPRMQIWPDISPWFDPAQARVYDFDLDKTKALLTEAGVPDLETEMTWRNNASESQLVAQIYQSDLARIGVKVNLKPLEPAVWNEYAISGKFAGVSIANANSANLSMSAAAVGTWMSPDNGITGFRSPGLVGSGGPRGLGDGRGEAEGAGGGAQQVPAGRIVDDAAGLAAAEDHRPQEPARHLVQPARDRHLLRRLARLTLLGFDLLPDLNTPLRAHGAQVLE